MNTTNSNPVPSAGFPEAAIVGKSIRSVYIWVLVGIGVPGNLACLVTVLSMHVTTATFYVALLAAADTVALLIKLLFHQLVTYQKMTTVACYLSFLASFFSCYAHWVLVLICVERFCTVLFPLKKEVCFTRRRIYVSVLLLTIALAVCFAPTPFFYADVTRRRTSCVQNEDMQKFKEDFFDVFLACLYFFFPFVLIAVFTTLIIIGLQRHRRARDGISTATTTTTEGSGASDGGIERSISIMLLSAGLVFLLLILPVCLYHLFFAKLYDPSVQEEAAQSFLLYQVVTLLSDTNHAVNFIVYFLSAVRFRRRFVGLLKRCFGCGTRGESTAKSSSSSEDAVRMTQISQSRTAEAEEV